MRYGNEHAISIKFAEGLPGQLLPSWEWSVIMQELLQVAKADKLDTLRNIRGMGDEWMRHLSLSH